MSQCTIGAGNEFVCPGCKRGLSVGWDTEYGDPVSGETDVACPFCHRRFNLLVEVTASYRVMGQP